MKFSLKNIMYSSWFLYFVVFIVFFNLVGHAINGNTFIIFIFILISFITSFFSKNMTIILLVGIVISNLMFYGPKKRNIEGMQVDADETMVDKNQDFEDNNNDLDIVDKLQNIPNVKSENLKKKMDEIKEVKERINVMRTKMPDLANSMMSPKDMDFMNNKYKELLKIQDDVLENINNLEKSIGRVDTIVEDVKQNINQVRSSIPTGLVANAIK